LKTDKKIKLFANCIPIKGATRSVVCDLGRNNYDFIPNDLFNVLEQNEGKTIAEIKLFYDCKYDDIIDEYFDFLLQKEYVFLTYNPELYPKLNTEFHMPFSVSNAIIDIGEKSNAIEILEKLEKINCKFIEIRFFSKFNIKYISQVLDFIKQSKSITSSIGFIIQNSEIITNDFLRNLLQINPIISYFIVSNATENKFIEPINAKMGYIYYTMHKIHDNSHCGLIDSSNFVVNIKLHTESLNYNSCLNKKISIDKDGNIKNCPSMPQSFGNIKDTSLEEALNHPDFKKYWNVTKDMISICKDCEFRHICTDCRAYTERNTFDGEIDLSKPLKCGYNPYTNEWAEWSTNPLKEKAIEYYGMQDLVKKDA
jgi:SPASM domain peptide maturase of grasp-with-spasm system